MSAQTALIVAALTAVVAPTIDLWYDSSYRTAPLPAYPDWSMRQTKWDFRSCPLNDASHPLLIEFDETSRCYRGNDYTPRLHGDATCTWSVTDAPADGDGYKKVIVMYREADYVCLVYLSGPYIGTFTDKLRVAAAVDGALGRARARNFD